MPAANRFGSNSVTSRDLNLGSSCDHLNNLLGTRSSSHTRTTLHTFTHTHCLSHRHNTALNRIRATIRSSTVSTTILMPPRPPSVRLLRLPLTRHSDHHPHPLHRQHLPAGLVRSRTFHDYVKGQTGTGESLAVSIELAMGQMSW